MDDSSEDFINEMKNMQNVMSLTIEELKENFSNMKQEFQDFLPVIRDFKGLLLRKPLFERSTFVYLSPLAKEIKAETMREVSSKLVGPTEELKYLKAEIKATLEEVSEKTMELNSLVKELTQENLGLKRENEMIRDHLDMVQRNLDDAREDLCLKLPTKKSQGLYIR